MLPHRKILDSACFSIIAIKNQNRVILISRKKVWLVSPDIPTRTTSPSIPTSKSDEYIELVNSDIDRDAAQTTVPFLDAQKLESLQPVPLSGAGIFHKGRKYFGGFITLKVMTYDYSRHIRAALSDEEVETNWKDVV